MNVAVAEEQLIARADRALFWPRRSTLFVADAHFGKAASFRAAAVPVPVGTTEATLCRLSTSLEQTGASKLVFLGDLYHAKEGRRDEIFTSLARWRHRHKAIEMLLVEGNHDRRSGVLPAEIGIDTVLEPFGDGPFALCHYPQEVDGLYCLEGHIHPAVSLRGKARQSMTLPCFWFGERVAVLPAFGEFTGVARICPSPDDRVLVIADGELHDVSPARVANI
jgi:DNA ligase-associated metallophosphoesterase